MNQLQQKIHQAGQFLVFSNLFIAGCAVIMAWHTSVIIPGSALPASLYLFIFGATLTSYSFHWLLTARELEMPPPDPSVSFAATRVIPAMESSRTRWMRQFPRFHLYMLLPAILLTTWSAWQLMAHWPWLLLLAVITFLYSAPKIPHPVFRQLRKIAVGKTIFLALVWTMVTVTLPLEIRSTVIHLPAPGGSLLAIESDPMLSASSILLFCSRFGLIYAICILFDIRDLEYDKAAGIRSLVTWLPPAALQRLYFFMLWLSLGCSILPVAPTVFALHGRVALEGFCLADILALGMSPVCALLIFRQATRTRSDAYYYAWLDGLMALSAVVAMLARSTGAC